MNFFAMKINHAPSLSHLRKLRLGTKVNHLSCLESSIELADDASVQPFANVTILDRAVVVNFLRPLVTKMFEEYDLMFSCLTSKAD